LDLTLPPFCCCSFLFSFVERLAQDAVEVAKLREEVTQAQADAVTVRACALLEASHGKE
jgi:16S rRNA G527 N7-methylase RsmG